MMGNSSLRASLTSLASFIVGLLIASGPARATEAWLCNYSRFNAQKPSGAGLQSLFRVKGDRLVEESGDAVVEYKLIENDKASVVAAMGGSYASEPRVMGFILLINKETGEFVLTTSSIGALNNRQTGSCRLVPDPASH